MSTLLIQLIGPFQSWGTNSRGIERYSDSEPSKSGVVGLLAAAMGIDRQDWLGLEPLANLSVHVRHDSSGIPLQDFQTAKNVIIANHPTKTGNSISNRHFLADTAFLVALEGSDCSVLKKIQEGLKYPSGILSLGRKAYIPSESIYIENGIFEDDPKHIFSTFPWIVKNLSEKEKTTPEEFLCSFETKERIGVMKIDQPYTSFSERKFRPRFVISEWVKYQNT
jgi:CRISPR system Cascade subunit CasD